MLLRFLSLTSLALLLFSCKLKRNENGPLKQVLGANIIAEDDREAIDPTEGPYTRIVRVKTAKAWCSGSLIGERLALTNAHCITDSFVKGRYQNNMRVYVGYRNDDYEGESRVIKVVAGFYKKGPVIHVNQDWAILVLDEALGDEYGFFKVKPYFPINIFNKPYLMMAGYPEDVSKKGFKPVVDDGCSVRLVVKDRLYHDCDSAKGSSGSAIFHCKDEDLEDCDLVALHAGRHGGTDKSTYHTKVYKDKLANYAVNTKNFYKKVQELRKKYPY